MAINDSREFEKYFKKIYPPELILQKENITNTETTFLDIRMIIENKTFKYKIYDKRDNFGFPINRLPFKSSNIPSRIFYNCINAEILRIFRASSKVEYAVETSTKLIKRMLHQGQKLVTSTKKEAELNNIFNGILRCLNKHTSILDKYSKSAAELVALLKRSVK